MKEHFLILLTTLLLYFPVSGQVPQKFLYNAENASNRLDIRTVISPTTYYYLKEGETFAFRESAPGVKTKSYKKITKWDSSPYQQGNLRYHNGTSDKFVMNYRLLMPANYSPTYADGYPLIVFLHGGIERGNCSFHNCYHSTWDYDPNLNAPKASTSPTHPLLNNDHHLKFGGQEHLDARNLAANHLPSDSTIPQRGYPGFVLAPQMLNDWDEQTVQDMLKLVQLHLQKYNIDQNRVYVHGLSVGGWAVYEALNKAPWLFAAAMPICASKDRRLTTDQITESIVTIPLWIFQGEVDPDPTVAMTKALIEQWKATGGTDVRYTEYPKLDHTIFNNVFAEPEFFSWLLSKDKTSIHAFRGITRISNDKKIYPKLMLSEGFFAYQWERNGELLGEQSHILIAKVPGAYRARFSRVQNPTEKDWNRWSAPFVITDDTTPGINREMVVNEDQSNSEIGGQEPSKVTSEKVNLQYEENHPTRSDEKRAQNAAGL